MPPHFVQGAETGTGSAAVATVPHVEQSQLRLRIWPHDLVRWKALDNVALGFHGSRCSRDEWWALPALAAFQVRRSAPRSPA